MARTKINKIVMNTQKNYLLVEKGTLYDICVVKVKIVTGKYYSSMPKGSLRKPKYSKINSNLPVISQCLPIVLIYVRSFIRTKVKVLPQVPLDLVPYDFFVVPKIKKHLYGIVI